MVPVYAILRKTQPELHKYLRERLTEFYPTTVISEDTYLFAEGNIPILLVAHLDTVYPDTTRASMMMARWNLTPPSHRPNVSLFPLPPWKTRSIRQSVTVFLRCFIPRRHFVIRRKSTCSAAARKSRSRSAFRTARASRRGCLGTRTITPAFRPYRTWFPANLTSAPGN